MTSDLLQCPKGARLPTKVAVFGRQAPVGGLDLVVAQHPSCARKLVAEALIYAKDLGFEPHADYRIARLIFGDIDADACPVSFTFGKDGRPFYINGQNDTPAMQRRIVKQLERRCGPGGYDYLMMV